MRLQFSIGISTIILSFLFIGCNNREIREVRRLYHKRISFDIPLLLVDSLEISEDINSVLQKPLKIVTYSDNYSCGTCMSNWLKIWNDVCDDLLINAELVIIVPGNDINGIQNLLLDSHLPNRILLDINRSFLTLNNLDNVLARNRTFLLDSKNHIILVGEPFKNANLIELYSKTIKELCGVH